MSPHQKPTQKPRQQPAEPSFTSGAGVRPRIEEGKLDFETLSVSEGSSLSTVAEVRDFGIVLDEPVPLGRDTTLPDPIELLLAVLGNAHAVAYRTRARILGLRVDRVEVETKGRVDRSDPRAPVLERVTFAVRVISPEPVETLRELARRVEQDSPATVALRSPAQIDSQLEVVSIGQPSQPFRQVA